MGFLVSKCVIGPEKSFLAHSTPMRTSAPQQWAETDGPLERLGDAKI